MEATQHHNYSKIPAPLEGEYQEVSWGLTRPANDEWKGKFEPMKINRGKATDH